MTFPLFNLAAMLPGDVICRQSDGLFDWAVRRATGGKWSHDALYLGNGLVGDALWNGGARATAITEWEAFMRDGKCKALVIRAIGITEAQGREAADWWMENVCGRSYDFGAIAKLGWGALWGRHDWGKLGVESSWYCTESVEAALHDAGVKPWWPKVKGMTPGTTYKRLTQAAPTFAEVSGAFTAQGAKYRIQI